MAKQFLPSVLTANDLVEGHSVFLCPEGWQPDIAQALVAVTPEQAEELLALGQRYVGENAVVGPYLIDVNLEDRAPVPVLRRERIRAAGVPSIPVSPALDRAAA